MARIEARTPVGKTIMSLFFTGMAVVGLIGGLQGSGGAWIVFLVFGGMAVYAWKNTLAHQRLLYEQARKPVDAAPGATFFCSACGKPCTESARFCSSCGARLPSTKKF